MTEREKKALRNKVWYSSLRESVKRERFEKAKSYFQKYPWLRSFYAARQRVFGSNPKHYLYKGLEFTITKEDVKELWVRDCAKDMTTPSIDRIDVKGGYTKANCRFIEKSLNTGRGRKEQTHCIHGHEFTRENTRKDKYGNRKCRECGRIRDRKYYEKSKNAGL